MPDTMSTNSLSLSAEAADKLITSRDGAAALLYLYLLRGNPPEAQAAMQALRLDSVSYSAARARLEELGLWPHAEVPAARTPDSRDITQLAECDEEFRTLLRFCERRYGRALSRADLERLVFLYDELGVPADVLAIPDRNPFFCCQTEV